MIHAERDADGRRHQSAPQAGQQTAQYEGKGEDPAHVDADGAHHFAVHCRGPGDLAEFGLGREQPQTDRDQRPYHEQKKIIPRESRTEHGNGPLQHGWRHDGPVVRAPGHLGEVSQNEHQSKGEQQQHQVLTLVEMTEEEPLGDQADHRHHQRSAKHGEPESGCTALKGDGDGMSGESADHVKRTVRDVGHPQDAENKAQAG